MSKRTALIQARNLILDRDNWTQGRMRQRMDGGKIAYCAVGAIDQAAVTSNRSVKKAVQAAINIIDPSYIHGGSIIYWNDTHSHQEVIAAFNLAIERAGGELPWLARKWDNYFTKRQRTPAYEPINNCEEHNAVQPAQEDGTEGRVRDDDAVCDTPNVAGSTARASH